MLRDRASLASPDLSPRPVHEFQVSDKRDRQKSFLAGAPTTATGVAANRIVPFMNLNRTHPTTVLTAATPFPLVIAHA